MLVVQSKLSYSVGRWTKKSELSFLSMLDPNKNHHTDSFWFSFQKKKGLCYFTLNDFMDLGPGWRSNIVSKAAS